MGKEKNAILDGVDLAPLRRINRNPAAEVLCVPLAFVCQREDMCSFKSSPIIKPSREIYHLGNDTTTVASLDCHSKRLHSSTRRNRSRSHIDNIVVDLSIIRERLKKDVSNI